MKEPYYNTVEGVSKAITTLEGLNNLIKARSDAGYKRKERMYEFYILGRYFLDTCGNFGVISKEFIPAEHIPDFPEIVDKECFWAAIETWQKKEQPDVLTHDEMHAPDFDWSANKRPYPVSISIGCENPIPPAHIVCPWCKKGWTIDNCYDVERRREPEEMINAENFIGETWQSIKNNFDQLGDALYVVERSIQKNRNVDLKPLKDCETFKADPIDLLKDVFPGYVIKKGDHIFLKKINYYHKECYIAHSEQICDEHRKNGGKNYIQGNLAGNIASDAYVKLELDLAGIPAEEGERYGEPGTCFKGKLGEYTFKRAWYYWMVSGPVPLDKAKIMYADEEGKKSVRVAGHCGCPPPEDWAHKGFVNSYHIDTWQGLKLFVDTVMKKAEKRKINKLRQKISDSLRKSCINVPADDPNRLRKIASLQKDFLNLEGIEIETPFDD